MNTLKKSTIVLLPLLLFLSCVTGKSTLMEKKQSRLSSIELYDGMENLIQSTVILYNGNNKPVEVLSTDGKGELNNRKTMEYTDTGKILSMTNFLSESDFIKTGYQYNDDDFLIKAVTENTEGKILGKNNYINDKRGNPIEWISEYPGNNEKVHFLMEYDESDRIIKSSEIDNSGNLIYFSVSEFDDFGNESSYTIYSPKGEIDQQLINLYKNNQLKKTEVKDEKGNTLFYTEYELNDSDIPVKISSYNQYEDLMNWIDLEIDDSGNEIIRKTYDFDGTLKEKIEKEYDSLGNITKLILYDAGENVISTTINSYDKSPLNMSGKEFNALIFKL
jgi:hypothetical protein